jgi:hypothetical protein
MMTALDPSDVRNRPSALADWPAQTAKATIALHARQDQMIRLAATRLERSVGSRTIGGIHTCHALARRGSTG